MVAIPPLDYNIQIPRPDLSSYAQRAQTMQNLQQSFGQFSQSIGQVLQAQIQAENQRKAQAQLSSDVALVQQNLTPENVLRFRTAHPDREDITKTFEGILDARQKQAQALALQQQKAIDFDAARKTGNWDQYFLRHEDDRKELYPIINDERRMAAFSEFGPVVAALQNGDSDTSNAIINKMIQGRLTAEDQAGADALRQYLVDKNLPYEQQKAKSAQALQSIGMQLAALDPQRYKDIREGVTIGAAEATRAAALSDEQVEKAKQAAMATGLFNRKLLAEIKKDEGQAANLYAAANLSRETARLRALEADLAKVINPIEKQKKQADLDKVRQDVEGKIKDANANLEKTRTLTSYFLAAAKKVQDTPAGVKENALGTIDAWLFGPDAPLGAFVYPETANFQENIKALTSQQFTQAIAVQGTMAGLSQEEGRKLQEAIGNLSLRQDVKQFDDNVKTIVELVSKIQSASETRFGPMQQQGVVNVKY